MTSSDTVHLTDDDMEIVDQLRHMIETSFAMSPVPPPPITNDIVVATALRFAVERMQGWRPFDHIAERIVSGVGSFSMGAESVPTGGVITPKPHLVGEHGSEYIFKHAGTEPPDPNGPGWVKPADLHREE